MSSDPVFQQVVSPVVVQLVTFYPIREVRSPVALLAIGYCWVGVINHSLMLAVRQRFRPNYWLCFSRAFILLASTRALALIPVYLPFAFALMM